jgi:tellurite resistance protein TerC
MIAEIWPWLVFGAVVVTVLALDLGVFHRKSHEVGLKEALLWTATWVTLALLFNAGVWYWMGGDRGLEFLTGYVVELSLSVDNLFVFLLIFAYFKVPSRFQHKVLFWGIVGALAMRLVFIGAGIALLERFHWVIYVFGGILVISGLKMALEKDRGCTRRRIRCCGSCAASFRSFPIIIRASSSRGSTADASPRPCSSC